MQIKKYKHFMKMFKLIALFIILVSLFLVVPKTAFAKDEIITGNEVLIILENSTGKRWSQLTQLNVFENAKFGGQQIIAPMSKGEYVFTIKNNAQLPLKYTLQISEENEARVPMKYRLKQDEIYLVGSMSEWIDVTDFPEVINELHNNGETTYVLEWYWIGDNDEVDTAAGIAAQNGAKYLLNFEVTAEQIETPTVPTEPSNPVESVDPIDPIKPTSPGSTPLTGDSSNKVSWLALAVSSGILLILFIQKKHDNTDKV